MHLFILFGNLATPYWSWIGNRYHFLDIWLIAEKCHIYFFFYFFRIFLFFFWYAPCYILIVESAHESAVRRELWVFSPSGTSDSARVRIFRFDLIFLNNNLFNCICFIEYQKISSCFYFNPHAVGIWNLKWCNLHNSDQILFHHKFCWRT